MDVYFDRPVVPRELQVFETYNPGAVVRILACYRAQTGPTGGPFDPQRLDWVTLWRKELPTKQHNTSADGSSPLLLQQHQQLAEFPFFSESGTLGESLILFASGTPWPHVRDGSVHPGWRNYLRRLAAQYVGRARVFQPTLVSTHPHTRTLSLARSPISSPCEIFHS